MNTTNVYQAPAANLDYDKPSIGDYGSLEKAVNGEYEFSIGNVLSEAWEKTSGAKWTIHLAFIYYFLVMMGLSIGIGILIVALTETIQGDAGMVISQVLSQVVINLVSLPLTMGIVLIAIRRSVGAPINAGTVFSCFSKTMQLFATLVLMSLMITIGFVLLVIPGIYLAVAYYMAMPLVVEKGLSPWQAMEVSRKTITRRWFSVFGLFIILGIIFTVSLIPLGLGAIWTLPMMMIAYGILYRNMFGVEADTIA